MHTETLNLLPENLMLEIFGFSASPLQVAHLEGIQIPSIPRFLSSSLGLVELRLVDIPHDRYISPETMVTSLAGLTGLVTLFIGFKWPTPLPETRTQDPNMRIEFPSLTTFGFHGVKEYLEDLVSQVDTPQLGHLSISYLNQLDFRTPQFSEFISRTQNLCVPRFTCARIDFDVNDVRVRLYEQEALPERHFFLRISCQGLDWQLGHLSQILGRLGIILSNVGGLSIHARALPPDRLRHIDVTIWSELLRPFTAVETLHVSGKSAGHFAHGLAYVTEEMLPVLHSLYLQDEPLTSVEHFVKARFLAGRAITVVNSPATFFGRPKSLQSWKEYLSN